MQPLTSTLPPDQQLRLHADFLANEQDYLRMRDDLLSTHRGQWVAVHGGKVVAAGADMFSVADQAEAAARGGHPFLAQVGEEATPFQVRRAEFAYDLGYPRFPLPRVVATFWNHAETQSQTLQDVIPDTGADLTLLPRADCLAIDLYSSPYYSVVTRGALGSGVSALIYRRKAEIDGRRGPAFIQPVDGGQERIMGRDVLNRHRVNFDGPAGRVVFGA